MSKLLLVLLVVSVGYGVYRISLVYEAADREERSLARRGAAEPVGEAAIPPLSQSMEAALGSAKIGGATTVRIWLESNARSIPEPRLSAIELDYAQLLIRSNPVEARRIFAVVKAKNKADSLLAARILKLAKTFY